MTWMKEVAWMELGGGGRCAPAEPPDLPEVGLATVPGLGNGIAV